MSRWPLKSSRHISNANTNDAVTSIPASGEMMNLGGMSVAQADAIIAQVEKTEAELV